MAAPIMNITFCGTNVEGTRKNSASIKAIQQFEDHLILSGVGSPDTYDAINNEHYPTPGSFTIDEQLKRQFYSRWMNKHFHLIYRMSGFFLGRGEKSNLILAFKHIENKMKKVSPHTPVTLNLTGYSRGGASAINFANMLYQKYGTQIHVNLFILDPNAGLGRQHFQFKKRVPHNVDNFYVVFNRKEVNPVFKALTIPHYFFMNPKTSVSALYVDGDHVAQDFIWDEAQEICSAQTNQHLLELFYESYGAKKTHNRPFNYSFEKNPLIQKGFVSYKSQETILDKAIRGICSQDQHDIPKYVEENRYLAQFNREIQPFNHRVLYELSYYFAHFLSEIDQGDYVTEEEQENSALLLQVTDNLIRAMTPSKRKTMDEKIKALDAFKQQAYKNHYSYVIVHIAAQIIGLATGLLLASVMAIGGFLVGLTRFDTLGLAAIPYTVLGAIHGAGEGYEWGKYQLLGHQNANKIKRRIYSLFKEESKNDFEKELDQAFNSFVARIP